MMEAWDLARAGYFRSSLFRRVWEALSIEKETRQIFPDGKDSLSAPYLVL